MLLTEALSTDSHAAPTPTASVADRLAGLDTAKVLAVFAIVWIHTPRSDALQPTATLGRFAVPFFVATTVLLIVKGLAEQPQRSLLRYARSRTHRLLLPLAAWTIIYLGLKLLKKVLAPQQPIDLPGWEALFLGSAYHLWFLPFLWALSLIVFPTARWVIARNRHEIAAAMALALGILFCLAPSPARSLPWDGVGFMWLALPAACWSLGFSLLWVRSSGDFPGPALRSLAAVTLLLATLLLLGHNDREPFAESLAGMSWLLLALAPPPMSLRTGRLGVCPTPMDGLGGRGSCQTLTRLPARQEPRPSAHIHPRRICGPLGCLASLAYGVYLSHLLFIKVGESVADRLQLPICPALDLSMFLTASVGSTCLAWTLFRCRYTRWLLG